MLLDSNILIYGAKGEYPGLDVLLDRIDLAVASVTRIALHGASPPELPVRREQANRTNLLAAIVFPPFAKTQRDCRP